MACDTTPQAEMLCAKCAARISATSEDALRERLFQILEISPDRTSAPNAKICRTALKARLGSKQARELIDRLLTDRVVPATKAYHRRHMMFIDKKPLRLLQQPPEEDATRSTKE